MNPTTTPPGVPGPSLREEPSYIAGLSGKWAWGYAPPTLEYGENSEQQRQYRIYAQGRADAAKARNAKGKK